MQYLDNASEHEWQQLFAELMQDSQAFFGSQKPFNPAGYRRNVQQLKQKKIPQSGTSFEALVADIRANVLPGAIHQHHKAYLAFPDKGSLAPAQYAAMLAAVTNQNLIGEDKSAPTGTYIEMLVITWLRQLIGFAENDFFPKNALELGGAFVPGGVMANTVGLLGARQRSLPESKSKGMLALKRTPKIFVAGSTMSHYSHYGASWWLGFGTDNVIEVKCTEKGNMDQADLIRKIEASVAAGEKPVAIIALAGDSRTNTLDDLPGLYTIAQKYDIWLHADACHGGVLAFDNKAVHGGKHYLSYCDSVTMDPHKHLGVPYANSVILFKNAYDLAAIGSSTDITIAYGGNDIGQVTPFLGSRGFDALKLYATIQHYGVTGIRQNIRRRKQITKLWYNLLSQSRVLMPMHQPELFALAFSVRPEGKTAAELSRRNLLVHDALHEKGDVIVHNYNMRDYRNALGYGSGTKVRALGSMFGSDDYSLRDLRQILHVIEKTYDDLFAVKHQPRQKTARAPGNGLAKRTR